MGLARLVVIEGPDLGREFDVPMRGGGVGRGEGMAVQLSDLAVSRHHCTLEWQGDGFVLVDASSRNRTLVNGEPVTRHPLEQGDEIGIGKTRLAFIPAEGGIALMRQGMPSRVTMEVGSGELLRAARRRRRRRDQRAAVTWPSLAGLGQKLREMSTPRRAGPGGVRGGRARSWPPTARSCWCGTAPADWCPARSRRTTAATPA